MRIVDFLVIITLTDKFLFKGLHRFNNLQKSDFLDVLLYMSTFENYC